MDESYHVPQVVDEGGERPVPSALEALAREGARRMLERALEAEVDEFLGRQRYERGTDFRGYRNGYQRPRDLALGSWSIEVRAPRVSEVPQGVPMFKSKIVGRQRLSQETQHLFTRLYLEGLSSGDFEPVFRGLLGEKAPLSQNTILRLKQGWAEEYRVWSQRPLNHARFVYVWADGIYLGAGLEKENSCMLTLLGAREDGIKELLAIQIGFRESKEAWADVLRDLRERGLEAPRLFVGDGNLGLWAALRDVFPSSRWQRCWNHRAMNLKDRLPKRLHVSIAGKLHDLYSAPTRQQCEAKRDELVSWLRQERQPAAAETLLRDWEDFVTFYEFPLEHWRHLRTTNPIESVFASVRLRTNVAKRARNRDNALYLVWKIVERVRIHWRVLNGGPTLTAAVAAGAVFKDGVLQPWPDQPNKEVVAA